MDDWIWTLVGVAVTLSVTVAVKLWHAFKHLDDKIERLGDKLDRKFDQMMAGIAETKLLVAGHAERIEAQEKKKPTDCHRRYSPLSGLAPPASNVMSNKPLR